MSDEVTGKELIVDLGSILLNIVKLVGSILGGLLIVILGAVLGAQRD